MKIPALATALALVASLVLTVAPAQAFGESTATTNTAYIGDGCTYHEVAYTVDLPAEVKIWSMAVQAIHPNGTSGDTVVVGNLQASPLTGRTAIQICGVTEPVGIWTLQPRVSFWQDANGETIYNTVGAPSTFEVVAGATTSLKLKAKTERDRVTARVRLIADTGSTSRPLVEQQVRLQKKVGKKWKNFKRLTTSGTGTAQVKFKVKKKTRIRARYAGSGEVVVGGSSVALPAAMSKVVRVG